MRYENFFSSEYFHQMLEYLLTVTGKLLISKICLNFEQEKNFLACYSVIVTWKIILKNSLLLNRSQVS